MPEKEPPFVDSGDGCPTADSAREALSMFKLDSLASTPVTYRGQPGSMVELLTHCRIEHLTSNWPKDFIAEVIGVASQAAQQE